MGWVPSTAPSLEWMYQSTRKMKPGDKRFKGLLCVEGLESACLRRVPCNRDLRTGTDLRAIKPSGRSSMDKGCQAGWTQSTGAIKRHTRYQLHAGILDVEMLFEKGRGTRTSPSLTLMFQILLGSAWPVQSQFIA